MSLPGRTVSTLECWGFHGLALEAETDDDRDLLPLKERVALRVQDAMICYPDLDNDKPRGVVGIFDAPCAGVRLLR